MKAVIQRVSYAQIEVNEKIISQINTGLLVLIGFGHDDNENTFEKFIQKILNLRIFEDQTGKMNLSLNDIDGELLLVSQFTLYANITKGNRPSFVEAARPEIALGLYNTMCQQFENQLKDKFKSGIFGADMKISLLNNGPVTIIW